MNKKVNKLLLHTQTGLIQHNPFLIITVVQLNKSVHISILW